MSHAHEHWIVTADARRAGAFACRMTPGGSLHLDPLRSIANEHEKDHEHGRPSMLSGPEHRRAANGSGAGASPRFASPGHEIEEMHRRFARVVGEWLSASLKELQPARIDVFAPPRFAAYLKEELQNEPTITIREGELANLRGPELAVHPAIMSALAAGRR